MGSGGRPTVAVNTLVTSLTSNAVPFSGTKVEKGFDSPGRRSTKGIWSGMTLTRLVGCNHRFALVETTNVPGATTSGLNRPDLPSRPRPTLPTLENAATSLFVLVSSNQGWLVLPMAITSL